jgi:hypothetical protein
MHTDTLAVVEHADYVVRLATLATHVPEQVTAPPVQPSEVRRGDLAVVLHHNAYRFALVEGRRSKGGMEGLSLLTPAAIARAGRAAQEVGGYPAAANHPGHVDYMVILAEQGARRNPDNSAEVVEQVARAARAQAYRDHVTALRLAERGQPWWACWAKVMTTRRPVESLVIIRD